MRYGSWALLALAGVCAFPGLAWGAVGATPGSFAVTPVGAAQYSMPIAVPPGIAGMEPKLAIQFDSRAGNSYLGLRFSIGGLSRISRCASNLSQDQIDYDPVDFDTNDRFCIDGQHLVSGTYGSVGAEYRTEIDSFRKIESKLGAHFNPQYFVVREKSGLVLTYGDYGQRSDARLVHLGQAAGYLWLLSKVQDPAGNYIEYRYVKDDSAGEVVPDEIRYTINDSQGIPSFAKVKFNYRPRLGPQPVGYLLGAPQSLSKILQSIESGLATTGGAFTSVYRRYTLGYEQDGIAQREQLNSIQECAAADCYPSTVFDWAAYSDQFRTPMVSSFGAIPNSRESFIGDFDADGRDDILSLTKSGALAAAVFRSKPEGGAEYFAPSLTNAPADAHNWTRLVADFDGDGRSDFAAVQLRSVGGVGVLDVHLWRNYWASSGPLHTFSTYNAIYKANTSIIPADVDGDGRKDLVLFSSVANSGVTIQKVRSRGDGTFDLPSSAGSLNDSAWAGGEPIVGDINRDGLTDFVYAFTSGSNVKFVSFSYAPAGFSISISAWQAIGFSGPYKAKLADVNGDGNGDVVLTSVLVTNTGLDTYSTAAAASVFLSLGNRQFARAFNGTWTFADPAADAPVLGDFNGDGLKDIAWLLYEYIINGQYAGLRVQPYYGTPDGQLIAAPSSPIVSVQSYVQVANLHLQIADVDGDARSDFTFQQYKSNETVVTAFPSGTGLAGFLSSITDGLGAQTQIGYKPLTDSSVYTVPMDANVPRYPPRDPPPGTNFALPPLIEQYIPPPPSAPSVSQPRCYGYPSRTICAPIYVVSGFTLMAETSSPRSFRRQYESFIIDLLGRGLLGPTRVTESDVTPSISADKRIVTTTDYSSTFPYAGMVLKKASVLATSGRQIVSVTSTLTYKTLTDGARTSYFPFAKQATESRYEVPPSPGTSFYFTKNVDYTYDDYGNLTNSTETLAPGLSFTSAKITTQTVNVFTNDAVGWRFLLDTAQVTRQRGSDPSKTRTTGYEYELGRRLLAAEVVEPTNAALQLRTDYGRDGFGNITSTKVSGADIQTRVACDAYSAAAPYYGRFKTGSVLRMSGTTCDSFDSVDHTYSRNYDPGSGQVVDVTDPNSLVTYFGQDSFGRPQTESFAQHGISRSKQTDWVACGSAVGCDSAAGDRYAVHVSDSTGAGAYAIYDAQQRKTATATKSPDGRYVIVRNAYDAMGSVSRSSTPNFAGSGYLWTTYQRDALGRILSETGPVSETQTNVLKKRYEYDGLIVREFDINSHRTDREFDVVGKLFRVIDGANATLSSPAQYGYDAFDNLNYVEGAGKSPMTMEYDVLGHKRLMRDPDMGEWTYVPDVLGQVKTQIDANKNPTQFDYDVLGRLRTRDETEGQTIWTYDTEFKGVLSDASAPDYHRSLTYYPHGALKDETVTIAGAEPPAGSVSISQFYADPATVLTGQTTYLTWAAVDAVQCSGTGTLPGWTGSKKDSGVEEFTVTTAGEYLAQLTCVNATGATAARTVRLTAMAAPPVTIDVFQAIPPVIREGAQVELSWSSRNTSFCVASPRPIADDSQGIEIVLVRALPDWNGSKPTSGVERITPYEGGQYGLQLTCRDSVGRKVSKTLTLTVIGCSPPELCPVIEQVESAASVAVCTGPTELLKKVPAVCAPSTNELLGRIQILNKYLQELANDPCGYAGSTTAEYEIQPTCELLSLPPPPACDACSLLVGATSAIPTGGSGPAYAHHYTYDTNGRIQDLTYPSGLTVRHGYGGNGEIISIANTSSAVTYWQAQDWDPWGQVKELQLGSGLKTHNQYDSAVGLVKQIQTGPGGGSSVQSLGYGWDSVGNLEHRSDTVLGNYESFAYNDPLYRLTDVTGPAGASLHVGHLPNGNIDSKSDIGQYGYGSKPHAVSATGTETYPTYDANGNLILGGGRSFIWASYNLPTRIDSEGSYAEFLYGPERQKIRQRYQSVTESKLIFYVGELYEEHRVGTVVEGKNYIKAPGGVVAIVTRSNVSIESTMYLHRDHLGSIVVTTDEVGQVLERLSYDAFGKRRSASGSSPLGNVAFRSAYGYTGHEHVDSVGLIHMRGRVYDPDIGRFVQADPFVPSPGYTQSLNRYSYAVNNPLNRTDPNGFDDEYTQIPRLEQPSWLNTININRGTNFGIVFLDANSFNVLTADSAVAISGSTLTMEMGSPASTFGMQLSFKTVVGPVEGPGSQYRWKIWWELDVPSKKGGWIVQEMFIDAFGGRDESHHHYWEAWPVGAGDTSPRVGDTWASGLSPYESGSITWTGSARFYEGLELPDTFRPYSVDPAGSLYATTVDPTLSVLNATAPIDRTVVHEWGP